MKQKLSLLLLFVISSSILIAQDSDASLGQIDEIFEAWNRPNHPGGVVAIMKGDDILFQNAYGLASLDYLVPNTNSTLFNIGSVTKQFTAMGIVVLERQGKLSVDDEVRKHIPELPDFGKKLTIRHMLQHTSGLRSYHAILSFAGWRGGDYRNNEDIYRVMAQQKELNFDPGAEFLYCNTGYILMAKIIENITEQPFPEWMEANVFEPLGLNNTYVEGNPGRIVPQNATSYDGYPGAFSRPTEYWGYYGSGNMHTTAQDLLLWLKNFYEPIDGWADAFERLQTTDPFNDGTPNEYAFGVNVSKRNNLKMVSHGGAVGGYRSHATVFPDAKLSIVVLTNFASSDPAEKSRQIMDILIGKPPEEMVSDASVNLSTDKLRKFEGHYWNDKESYARRIYLKNDTLRYWRGENNETPLIPTGQNTFRMLGILGLTVAFEGDGSKKQMVVSVNDDPSVFVTYQPRDLSIKEMKEYVGRYHSPETDFSFRLFMKEEQLMIGNLRLGDGPVSILKPDILDADGVIIRMSRGKNGKVDGLRASNGRVRNLWFKKSD